MAELYKVDVDKIDRQLKLAESAKSDKKKQKPAQTSAKGKGKKK